MSLQRIDGVVAMPRRILRDDPYARIEAMLPGKASDVRVTAKNNRLFVEAVLWIARTGAPWRDLPKSIGRSTKSIGRSTKSIERSIVSREADPKGCATAS